MIDNSPQRENYRKRQPDMDVNMKALPNLCQGDETRTHTHTYTHTGGQLGGLVLQFHCELLGHVTPQG